MQSQIKTLDLLSVKPAAEYRTMNAKSAHRADASMPEQMNEFMEIMGALMTLPPQQLKSSLADFDATRFEADPEAFASLIDLDRQDLEASEILQAFLQMNNAQPATDSMEGLPTEAGELIERVHFLLRSNRLPEAQDAILKLGNTLPEARDAILKLENALPELASTLPESQTAGDLAENRKATWHAIYNQIRVGAQTGGDSGPAGSDQAGSHEAALPNRVIRKTAAVIEALKLDLEIDSDTDPELDDRSLFKTALSEVAPKTVAALKSSTNINSVPPAQINSGLDPKSDLQNAPAGSPDTSTQKQPLFSAVADSGIDHSLTELSAESISDGDDLDSHTALRTSLSETGRQTLLSRPELKSDSTIGQISENKMMLPTEKELQTDVIRQIVQRMSMHSQGTQSKMVIQLKPEFLGNVHMQVLTENHQVTVRMMTDSLAVKEIVEQNIQHLKLELQSHGLEIQKFDVFVGSDGQEWRNGQDQAGFRQALRQRQQRLANSKTGENDTAEISASATQDRYTHKDPNEIDYFV